MSDPYAALAGFDWNAISNFNPSTATYNIAEGGGIPDIQVVTPPPSSTTPAGSPSSPTPSSSGGGGSTGYSPPQPPPPPPAPLLPTFRPMPASNKNILMAPSDIIQFDDTSVTVALMQDLLFEDVGAVELANISRSDLIDGQPTIYSPIKNLSTVRREFNPNTLIATSFGQDYFSRFGIDIFARGTYEPYFDDNGDLVIEVDTILEGEEIQVQVLSNGTIDTIEET